MVGGILFNNILGRKAQGKIHKDISLEEFCILIEAAIWVLNIRYPTLTPFRKYLEDLGVISKPERPGIAQLLTSLKKDLWLFLRK